MILAIIQNSHPQLQTATLFPASAMVEEGQRIQLTNGQGLLYICVDKEGKIETYLRTQMQKPIFEHNATTCKMGTGFNFKLRPPTFSDIHPVVLRILGKPSELRALSHQLTCTHPHSGQITLCSNLAQLIQRTSAIFDPYDL